MTSSRVSTSSSVGALAAAKESEPSGKAEAETTQGRADVGGMPTAETLGALARKVLSSSRHAESRELARAAFTPTSPTTSSSHFTPMIGASKEGSSNRLSTSSSRAFEVTMLSGMLSGMLRHLSGNDRLGPRRGM